jgi:ParB/RepB/Spo0J family partition protein
METKMSRDDGRMADAFKESVPMSLIRPSETNPREDMGDLQALARSIEATGGQPVSPIVVVPDGGVYRIVDGERRFRALGVLGAERAECVVVDGYDAADELVAMMATDDKKRLTDEERARGTQRMLRLDVPEGRAAGALGATAEGVRRARRVVRDAPEQVDLGVMIAAADESFSEEERKSVLGCASDELAEAKAGQIRRRHKADAETREVRAAIDHAQPGVEYRDGLAPLWSPESEGLLYLGSISTPDPAKLARVLAGADDDAPVVAYRRAGDKAGYELFVEDAAAERGKAEEAERKRRDDELTERYRDCFSEMLEWAILASGGTGAKVMKPWPDGSDEFVCGHRSLGYYAKELMPEERIVRLLKGMRCNPFEIVLAIATRYFGRGRLTWNHRIDELAAKGFIEAYDWCRDHGWAPSTDEEGLRATMADWRKWGAGDGH